jgi:hypothetical protein
VYYEHERTGSIYSLRELTEIARRERSSVKKLLRHFRPVPCSIELLLREAEAIAARAEEDRGRRRSGWMLP